MIDWEKTAFIFPGQGSQRMGMCRELAATYPIAKQIFEEADNILDYKLSELCFYGDEACLGETIHTQPAMFVAGIAMLKIIECELGYSARPAYMAGHSLGEFTALAAAGGISFEQGLRLVCERARLMEKAGNSQKGQMLAVIGGDIAPLEEVCEQTCQATGKIIVVANDNCPGQVVISGEAEAVEYALPLIEKVAKKIVKLPISIAAHSPVMAPIAAEFERVLANAHIQDVRVPMVANATANLMTTQTMIMQNLTRQMTSRVRWTEAVQMMRINGIQNFVELGPGGVLTGLLKRIDREAVGLCVESVENMQTVCMALPRFTQAQPQKVAVQFIQTQLHVVSHRGARWLENSFKRHATSLIRDLSMILEETA